MALFSTAIALGGLALGAVGAGISYMGQKQQAGYAAQQVGIQQQQDVERKKAMELDATRRKRDMIRQSIAARSKALSMAANQGSLQSSLLPGVFGGISGRTNTNMLGVDQNLMFGENMFDLTSQSNQAKIGYAEAGATASLGAGLSSLGGGIIKNLGQIDKIGTTVGSWFNTNPIDIGTASSFYNA